MPGLADNLFHTMAHEAGKHCHHHLRIHLNQVVRQRVDTSADLTGQWDCIPERGKGKERGSETKALNVFLRAGSSWSLIKSESAGRDPYLALLRLSSSCIIITFSSLFTMSHLTVPGAMMSIRSITGRLVLISLSCKNHSKTGSNVHAAKYNTHTQHVLTH